MQCATWHIASYRREKVHCATGHTGGGGGGFGPSRGGFVPGIGPRGQGARWGGGGRFAPERSGFGREMGAGGVSACAAGATLVAAVTYNLTSCHRVSHDLTSHAPRPAVRRRRIAPADRRGHLGGDRARLLPLAHPPPRRGAGVSVRAGR